jgi:hypothetical protein
LAFGTPEKHAASTGQLANRNKSRQENIPQPAGIRNWCSKLKVLKYFYKRNANTSLAFKERLPNWNPVRGYLFLLGTFMIFLFLHADSFKSATPLSFKIPASSLDGHLPTALYTIHGTSTVKTALLDCLGINHRTMTVLN